MAAPEWFDRQRQINEAKAEQQAEAGPAREDPSAAPVAEAIEDFHRRGDIAYGVPSHRSRAAGIDAYWTDVSMNNGVDNRHQSWQVEHTAMKLFAKAVGADETLFSTNGSTENVHVAMLAAVRPGQKLVMARNGHKSAFSGLVLSGAMPVYVAPEYDHRWQLAHGVDPANLDQTLTENPDAAAAMIFTPTYYGVSADVAALADVAHAHDVPLLTDDAWGLDFSFCTRLPKSALESGADLCIGSVHKSLDGLCQTSVLSRQGDRINSTRLSLVFELIQSTSASAVLLQSIDRARQRFAADGERLLSDAIDLAHRVRAAIVEMPGLDLMGEEILGSPGALALDPTHITVDVIGLGLTGYRAADWLLGHCGVHVELADHRRIMPILTFADTNETAQRLVDALEALCNEHADADPLEIAAFPMLAEIHTETVMLPRDAVLGDTEMVGWHDAVGRVSAEMICPYPPGIPLIAPGEIITDAVMDYLQRQVAAGAMVEGAADESLAQFRVSVTC